MLEQNGVILLLIMQQRIVDTRCFAIWLIKVVRFISQIHVSFLINDKFINIDYFSKMILFYIIHYHFFIILQMTHHIQTSLKNMELRMTKLNYFNTQSWKKQQRVLVLSRILICWERLWTQNRKKIWIYISVSIYVEFMFKLSWTP